MNKFRTVVALIVMAIAGIVGFFISALLNDNACGCAILFSMIAGIASIVYVLDNPNSPKS